MAQPHCLARGEPGSWKVHGLGFVHRKIHGRLHVCQSDDVLASVFELVSLGIFASACIEMLGNGGVAFVGRSSEAPNDIAETDRGTKS